MVQIIPQEDYGAELGQQFGQGFSSGLDRLMQAKMNQLENIQKQNAFDESFVRTAQAAGLTNDEIKHVLSHPQDIKQSMMKGWLREPEVISALQVSPTGEEEVEEKVSYGPVGDFLSGMFTKENRDALPQGSLTESFSEFLPEVGKGITTGVADVLDLVRSGERKAEDFLRASLGEKIGGGLSDILFGAGAKIVRGLEDKGQKGIGSQLREQYGDPKTAGGRYGRRAGEFAPWFATAASSVGLPTLFVGLLGAAGAGQLAQEAGGNRIIQMGAEMLGPVAIGSLGRMASSPRTLKDVSKGITNYIMGGEVVAPEAYANYVEKEVLNMGITPEEFAKGTPAAQKATRKVIKNASKQEPTFLNQKINQVYGEQSKDVSRQQRKEVLDQQQRYHKRTARVRGEVAEEVGRKKEIAAKETRKGEKVRAREAIVKESAVKPLQEAKTRFGQAAKSLSKAKTDLRLARAQKSNPKSLEKLQNTVDRLQLLTNEAKNDVKRFSYQKAKGKEYKLDKDLITDARNKARAIIEDVKLKPQEQVLKENKLDKLAKEMKGRKTIPGQETLPKDTHTRIYEEHLKAYEKRLDDVNRQLKYASDKQEFKLLKEKDTLKKLVNQAKGRLSVHRRRLGLQDLGKTVERQQKLKGTLPSGKPEKVAQSKLKTAAAKADKQASQAVSETVKESSEIKKALNDVQKIANRKGGVAKFSKGIRRGIFGRNLEGLIKGNPEAFGRATGDILKRYVLPTITGVTAYTIPSLYIQIQNKLIAEKYKKLSPPARSRYMRELDISSSRKNKIRKMVGA